MLAEDYRGFQQVGQDEERSRRPRPGDGIGGQRDTRPGKLWSGPGGFSSGPHREPLGDDRYAWTPGEPSIAARRLGCLL
jgi:hypothetical protein